MASVRDNYQQSKPVLRERLSFARRLPELASRIHSGQTRFTSLKRSLKFCVNGLRHQSEFSSLLNFFACPELSGVLTHFPALLEKPFHPYLRADWGLVQRRIAIEKHFSIVKEIFALNADKIFQPGGYQLFEFVAKTDEVFSVELFPGYLGEGSMGIRLCDEDGEELYSLTFHLDYEEGRTLTIGALQGPNDRVPERQAKISMLTKSLFGLRPKALMLEVLYMVAANLSVIKIYGISNQGHIYQSKYYSDEKRSKMKFDVDGFWAEYKAVRTSNLLFEFPQSLHRKDIDSLKSSKRSQYRKRYAWLDQAEAFVDEALGIIVEPESEVQHLESYSHAA